MRPVRQEGGHNFFETNIIASNGKELCVEQLAKGRTNKSTMVEEAEG